MVWTEATDRAETSEVLEERLHEVEAEVQESRVDSCWHFQALRFDLYPDFVGSVDHYDIGNWLGLRQDLL